MINWKNLDTLNSYGNLSEVDKVRLSEVMSADRVKSYRWRRGLHIIMLQSR